MKLLHWYLYYNAEEEWKGNGYYSLDSVTYQQISEAEKLPGFIRHYPEINGNPTPDQWQAIMIEVAELMQGNQHE